MKGAGPALVGVVVTSAVVAGLLYWGRSRDAAKRKQMAADDPTIDPVGMFPGLKVGDIVIVDSAAARLPMPFAQSPKVPCEVDRVLLDPAVVSVQCPPGRSRFPGVAFFSGTIPRSSILNLIPPVSFEV